jgi:DNA-binding MarR family transcriptional regulator
MGPETAWASAAGQLDLSSAYAGLAVVLEACERATEELGSSVPPAQMRALLIIEQAGSLNLTRLAAALKAKAPATSKLCDRMQAAGLLTRDRAADSRREIVLVPTQAGKQLAQWVRDRRSAALAGLLQSLTPEGQESLIRGLQELAAAQQ